MAISPDQIDEYSKHCQEYADTLKEANYINNQINYINEQMCDIMARQDKAIYKLNRLK
jgi:hypothetical protein